MDSTQMIRTKFEALSAGMDEAMRRRWAATEARAIGRGGLIRVSMATKLSLPTIRRRLKELEKGSPLDPHRIRRAGGGRKRVTDKDPTLLEDLETLVDPGTRGDPMSPLRWTCKSTPQLARELCQKGHQVSAQTVATLLYELDYSLQVNQKTREGATHPDRNAQFEYIAARVQEFQRRGQPVISVDTKKKELVGDFRNGGREWQPKGRPERVRVHDFPDKELGKAIPYGVYDLAHNEGWVSVGNDHDTAAFAVASIRHWWQHMGYRSYPQASDLLIMADGGGSNSARARLWKVELQRLADDTGIRITVCHFPPGTSKWNKIEHRMFCHITENWRGKPLISHQVIVNLIANTTTQQGLKIQAQLDASVYPTGLVVSDDQLAAVHIKPDSFHGEWNYRILPERKSKQKS
jgi:hypothetical protein